MNCDQIQADQIAERYITHQLAEAERDAYEEHYFACDRCNDELTAMLAIQRGLREGSVTIPASSSLVKVRPIERAAPATPGFRTRLWWAAAAVIVVAAGGAFVWNNRPGLGSQTSTSTQAEIANPSQSTETALLALASYTAPGYRPATFRGDKSEATKQFEAAMKNYVAGDFAAAIPALRSAVALDNGSVQARFYLAASELLTGESDSAITDARALLALGDSPFSESGHFLLGKAMLAKKDVGGAQREFEAVVQLRGDMEAEAQTILTELKPLSSGAPGR
jgi:TolA-binding protein